eukprot:209486-Rhodomonas_salina.1
MDLDRKIDDLETALKAARESSESSAQEAAQLFWIVRGRGDGVAGVPRGCDKGAVLCCAVLCRADAAAVAAEAHGRAERPPWLRAAPGRDGSQGFGGRVGEREGEGGKANGDDA